METTQPETINPQNGTAQFHDRGHPAIVVLMAAISGAAIVGNTSNIVVITQSCQLRRVLSNFFVLSLCAGDLLAAVLVMPVGGAVYALGHWPFNDVFCTAEAFLGSLSTFVSMTTLCVISVERYYSIRLPMHHAAHMSLCKTLCIVGVVWSWATLLAGIPLLAFTPEKFSDLRFHCSFTWQQLIVHDKYVVVAVTTCFILPGSVIVIMYIGIFREARLASMQVRPLCASQSFSSSSPTSSHLTTMVPTVSISMPSVSTWWEATKETDNTNAATSDDKRRLRVHTHRSSQGSLKAAKTLLMLLLAFLFLWGPFFVLHVHGVVVGSLTAMETSELVTIWLGYCSCAVNPLLYGWMNQTIRKDLLSLYGRLFCWRCCFAPNVPSSTIGENCFVPENQSLTHEDFFQFLERTSHLAAPPLSRPNSSCGQIPDNHATSSISNADCCVPNSSCGKIPDNHATSSNSNADRSGAADYIVTDFCVTNF